MENNKNSFIKYVLEHHYDVCFVDVFMLQKGSVLFEATFVFACRFVPIASLNCSDYPFTPILSNSVNGSLLKYISNSEFLYHFNVYFTTEIENIYVPEDICLEKFC